MATACDPVLQIVDAVEAFGIDPADAAPEYWHHVHIVCPSTKCRGFIASASSGLTASAEDRAVTGRLAAGRANSTRPPTAADGGAGRKGKAHREADKAEGGDGKACACVARSANLSDRSRQSLDGAAAAPASSATTCRSPSIPSTI